MSKRGSCTAAHGAARQCVCHTQALPVHSCGARHLGAWVRGCRMVHDAWCMTPDARRLVLDAWYEWCVARIAGIPSRGRSASSTRSPSTSPPWVRPTPTRAMRHAPTHHVSTHHTHPHIRHPSFRSHSRLVSRASCLVPLVACLMSRASCRASCVLCRVSRVSLASPVYPTSGFLPYSTPRLVPRAVPPPQSPGHYHPIPSHPISYPCHAVLCHTAGKLDRKKLPDPDSTRHFDAFNDTDGDR